MPAPEHPLWRTTAFHPASADWWLLYMDDSRDDGYRIAPLPGWLLQEAIEPDAAAPRTRVVAADHEAGELVAADRRPGFWQVLPPGFPRDRALLMVAERKAAAAADPALTAHPSAVAGD
ncbi:hypothetical protein [Planomonospora sp. ID82291]|uniref:hypothetical protein n=1 Tax=Planomonospora sp. ID82291 TaxID=2738136 RepID=UPI0018C37200|nr:hypothetical protein [Planomonospora sp. ID82291]MBG0818722.1 hypothetical protein [Planomonospora sp. ID82291]